MVSWLLSIAFILFSSVRRCYLSSETLTLFSFRSSIYLVCFSRFFICWSSLFPWWLIVASHLWTLGDMSSRRSVCMFMLFYNKLCRSAIIVRRSLFVFIVVSLYSATNFFNLRYSTSKFISWSFTLRHDLTFWSISNNFLSVSLLFSCHLSWIFLISVFMKISFYLIFLAIFSKRVSSLLTALLKRASSRFAILSSWPL